MAQTLRIMLAATCIIGLSGCFRSAADFRTRAEKFIVDDAGIEKQLGVDMVTATCVDPVDQNVGTTFACTATDVAQGAWGFEVTIVADNQIELSVSSRP